MGPKDENEEEVERSSCPAKAYDSAYKKLCWSAPLRMMVSCSPSKTWSISLTSIFSPVPPPPPTSTSTFSTSKPITSPGEPSARTSTHIAIPIPSFSSMRPSSQFPSALRLAIGQATVRRRTDNADLTVRIRRNERRIAGNRNGSMPPTAPDPVEEDAREREWRWSDVRR